MPSRSSWRWDALVLFDPPDVPPPIFSAATPTGYHSIRKLLTLALFMCHDYKAPGRDTYAWETTVREEREKNVHVKEGVGEDDFVAMRNA